MVIIAAVMKWMIAVGTSAPSKEQKKTWKSWTIVESSRINGPLQKLEVAAKKEYSSHKQVKPYLINSYTYQRVFYYPIYNDITALLNVFVIVKIEDGATELSSMAADAATTNAPKENGSGM